MDKAAIKSFAIEARKKLIASVKDKAGRIGITKENITDAIKKGEGFAVFPTEIGIEATLVGNELKQRENLVNRIKKKDYEPVMEEVAYTWFNRIIAVRFMEVNDYLPSRIRVLSSETKGKFEPDIVTQAPNIDLELSQEEIEKIISLKEKNELDQLFRLLFIKQCNELGKILPELFEHTSKSNKDYTEILLDISYTNEDGVIRDLLKIDEEDFLEAVEIIGWIYQYYNTEPKDETFVLLKKNIKITKERIPAATQLFTPDWIVRYMVENSLGRLWLEGHPNDVLKAKWKYFLEEAEQEPDVALQLEQIRAEYKKINPEEIKVIDPCMGSGHILVYAFEVLMQIYESCGYTQRDAAQLIVEKNLYGLDIDNRAFQLAYFAVMMKGRKYDRRFLTKGITPNLCSIQDSNSLISFEQGAGQLKINDLYKETANYLIGAFRDAKEYGSILNIEQRDYDGLLKYIEELRQNGTEDLFVSQWINSISGVMPILIKQAKIMAQKYDVVVTNPPYMSSSSMNNHLSSYTKRNYKNSKNDLFAVFIEQSIKMLSANRFVALITQQSWMFLKGYENLRKSILNNNSLICMAHLGARAFEEISGEVVQTATFVLRKTILKSVKSCYIRLVDFDSQASKEAAYLNSLNMTKDVYFVNQDSFNMLPGRIIAYWASKTIFRIFSSLKQIKDFGDARQGMATGNNDFFVRFWFEPSNADIAMNCHDYEEFCNSQKKYIPYTKSSGICKWYGNYYTILRFDSKHYQLLSQSGNCLPSRQFYFKENANWSLISTGKFGARYAYRGSAFDVGAHAFFGDKNVFAMLAYLNSKVFNTLILFLSPTLNYNSGVVELVPCSSNFDDNISQLAIECVNIAKLNWDSFETSWDFKKHPFILMANKGDDTGGWENKIEKTYADWEKHSDFQFLKLKANEEELNRIFIEIYGLQDELTPEVEDKDVTIRKADLQRDMKSFVSYAVGCMLGRYSLDVDGLAYAGGAWDDSNYKTFIPDKDNVLPITDDEYFDDDIVARFVNFVKVVYGEDTLEENLDFIANALGNRGSTSREIIRNYFLRDFYKDHVKIYKKRPIYWLFDSGKENGFKALIYLHRYNEDTVGRVRTDYLHRMQAALEDAIAHCDVVLESNVSGSEKAKVVKKKEKLVKQLAETCIYDQAIAHVAHQRIPLDLDDGVKVNYAKFQGVIVSSEGKKPVKVDLLGKI